MQRLFVIRSVTATKTANRCGTRSVSTLSSWRRTNVAIHRRKMSPARRNGKKFMGNKYEHRANSGSLWPNRRRSSEKAPRLTGTAKVLIDDREVELEVSGWIRESKSGVKWIAL